MPLALGALAGIITLLCLYGLTRPVTLLARVQGLAAKGGIWFAVLVRIALAVLLWLTAPDSRTPLVFQVLAALAAIAAIALPLIGRERLLRLLARIAAAPLLVLRGLLLFGMAFGLFLLWSLFA